MAIFNGFIIGLEIIPNSLPNSIGITQFAIFWFSSIQHFGRVPNIGHGPTPSVSSLIDESNPSLHPGILSEGQQSEKHFLNGLWH
jgi:hypothetical protein